MLWERGENASGGRKGAVGVEILYYVHEYVNVQKFRSIGWMGR